MTHSQIPQVFGKSKIKMLRGEDADERHQRRTRGTDEMSFVMEEDLSAVQMRPPSFNVLYVQTPRVGLLATPQFQLLAQTWQETVELVRPLLRFGFPETSLRTKCPYYDEDLHATASGPLLATDRLRKVMNGIKQGALHPRPSSSHPSGHQQNGDAQQQEQQQQHMLTQQQLPQLSPHHSSSSSSTDSASAAAYGSGNMQFLSMASSNKQHMYKHVEMVPKGNFLVPDIPSGTLVLTLNLMAYWYITKQSRRGGFGA